MDSPINQSPFFSIGVTTYNRKEFLAECIKSIASQDFHNYEVIVGNDFTREHLTYRELGVKDKRIRIINNFQNLGEAENMRMLLRLATGKYFTWLADDEVYAPSFLSSVWAAFLNNDVSVVYTSVITGISYPQISEDKVVSDHRLFTGREFLSKYLEGSIHAQGNYGVFKRSYIESIGWRKLGDGFEGSTAWGPYSDTRLLVLAGGLPNVAYIATPKIFMRTHTNSISIASGDLNAYISGQTDLFKDALPILRISENLEDTEKNVVNLFTMFIDHFFTVLKRTERSRWFTVKVSIRYGLVLLRLLKGENRQLKRVRSYIFWKYIDHHFQQLKMTRYGNLINWARRLRFK